MEDAEALTEEDTIPPLYTHKEQSRTLSVNVYGDYLNVAIDREHMDCDREGLINRPEGRRTVAGLNLLGDEPRKLRDALNEYLGETPAAAGSVTVKVNVDDADALDKLTALRREIDKLLDALPPFVQGPPTITITNHFPEPPADPDETVLVFENVSRDGEDDSVLPPDAEVDFDADEAEADYDEECVDLADDVLRGIRLAAGLDPSDDSAKLALLSRTTAERLARLLRPNGVLLTLGEQLDANGADVPLIRSEDEREAYREIIETKAADIARERDLLDILRDAFTEPQDSDGDLG